MAGIVMDGLNVAIVCSGEEYDPETQRVYKIGAHMPDGSLFAGISPDTGKAMYTTPNDAPLSFLWKQAMDYAKKLDSHGHTDWRVPTRNELNVLFNNRAELGNFNESGASPAGWYITSSQHDRFSVSGQRFIDGYQVDDLIIVSSLRCVRG